MHNRAMSSDPAGPSTTKRKALIAVVVVGLSVNLGLGVVGAVWGARRATEERLIAAIPPHAELTRDDRLRLARAIDATVGSLISDPRFDAEVTRATGMRVSNTQERKNAARALTTRGMSGLNDAQLDEVFAIKLDLARRSTAVCAGMWNGRIAEGEVFAAIAKLPNERMLRWMTLSAEGARLALRRDFVVPAEDSAAIDAVIARARDGLDGERRTRFQRVIDGGAAALPLEGCATWIEVLESAQTAEPPLRHRFYRAMARP